MAQLKDIVSLFGSGSITIGETDAASNVWVDVESYSTMTGETTEVQLRLTRAERRRLVEMLQEVDAETLR